MRVRGFPLIFFCALFFVCGTFVVYDEFRVLCPSSDRGETVQTFLETFRATFRLKTFRKKKLTVKGALRQTFRERKLPSRIPEKAFREKNFRETFRARLSTILLVPQ